MGFGMELIIIVLLITGGLFVQPLTGVREKGTVGFTEDRMANLDPEKNMP